MYSKLKYQVTRSLYIQCTIFVTCFILYYYNILYYTIPYHTILFLFLLQVNTNSYGNSPKEIKNSNPNSDSPKDVKKKNYILKLMHNYSSGYTH